MSGKKKVVIIGSGPAGLTAGLELAKSGFEVTIIEREKLVGGISKTVEYRGFRFDVGGHRFFTKNEEVMKIWKDTLGKEFRKTPRLSRIYYNKRFFKYPIELKDTIKNAGAYTSVLCLFSYLRYKISPLKPEKSFADWITNRFGKKLYLMFFKSYTEKVWGISTDELSADWAAQRIKGLSLWEAVRNAVFKPKVKAKSLIDEFLYPKYGPGMMYETMAENIKRLGGKIILGMNVVQIVSENNRIIKIECVNSKGDKFEYAADSYILTIPLPKTIEFLHPPAKSAKNISDALKFRDFLSVNLIVKEKNIFPDNWIYVHDPSVIMGRIQNYKNWSKQMTPDQNFSPIGCEYFCNQGDDLWNTKDSALIKLATEEVDRMGLVSKDKIVDGAVYRMRDAYPVYEGSYQAAINQARQIIKRFTNLQVAGRGGMFRYNNMDHSILAGLYAARNILGSAYNVWGINAEEEYHEVKEDK